VIGIDNDNSVVILVDRNIGLVIGTLCTSYKGQNSMHFTSHLLPFIFIIILIVSVELSCYNLF